MDECPYEFLSSNILIFDLAFFRRKLPYLFRISRNRIYIRVLSTVTQKYREKSEEKNRSVPSTLTSMTQAFRERNAVAVCGTRAVAPRLESSCRAREPRVNARVTTHTRARARATSKPTSKQASGQASGPSARFVSPSFRSRKELDRLCSGETSRLSPLLSCRRPTPISRPRLSRFSPPLRTRICFSLADTCRAHAERFPQIVVARCTHEKNISVVLQCQQSRESLFNFIV